MQGSIYIGRYLRRDDRTPVQGRSPRRGPRLLQTARLELRASDLAEGHLVSVHRHYSLAGGLSGLAAESVHGLFAGTHGLLRLPEAHYQHFTALAVGETQDAIEAVQLLECWQNPLRGVAGQLLYLLRRTFEPAYSRELLAPPFP
jgi:hypothetical protein